jgi:hypothetical protein
MNRWRVAWFWGFCIGAGLGLTRSWGQVYIGFGFGGVSVFFYEEN